MRRIAGLGHHRRTRYIKRFQETQEASLFWSFLWSNSSTISVSKSVDLIMNISVSELLPEEKRRLHELELQFNEVERGSLTVHASDVSLGIDEMSNRLDELEKMIQNEPIKRREDCKRRLLHLRNSHSHIKVSLENWVRRSHAFNFEAQQNSLFGNADLEGGTISQADAAENSSLSSSSRMINQYIAVGQETLGNLVGQKERLKSIHRKVHDVLNFLGLSNTIMRTVERRDVVDKWIVYAGMTGTTLLLVFVYFYLR